MAKLDKVQSVFFSPTGNVRKIVDAVSKGVGYQVVKPVDLTLPTQREAWSGSVESNLVIVGVPVHAGSFPSLLLPYLKKLDGTDRWAVPVAVCGNAQMRNCLPDLSGVLKKQGFKIAAAANFVGQHSFYTEELPMGKGRPDRRDLRMAHSFGRKVAAKMESDPTDISMVRGGNIWLRVYLTSSVESQGSTFPAAMHSVIRVSELDETRCDNCQSCVESCPTGAIDSQTLKINDAACIRCFACTGACPLDLRKKVVSPDPDLRTWF
ncbi:4Fe-4S binding protein [Candidatus Bathyarchaeota archaeon]|nr:4Fe-4S binding protein [Candidatus Bathyarchaeota archaeon]